MKSKEIEILVKHRIEQARESLSDAKMKKEINRITEDNGYECPVICSPEELEGK